MTYLKANNPLYSNIELITDNIPQSLSNLGHSDDLSDCDDDIDFDILKTCDEEIEDPMSDNRVSSSETTLISNTLENELSISPCEGKTPLSVHDDEFGEE